MTTTPPIEDSVPTDGRTARSRRTRTAIVDATMDLVNSGIVRPTAVQVAERAGVSVRSVFQHFDDLEGLFWSMGSRAFEQMAGLAQPIDPSAPLSARASAYVEQRCAMNEAISPVMHAAVVHVHNSSSIARQFQEGHDIQRVWIAEVFASELALVEDRAGFLTDALLIPTAWVTWSLLRHLEHRSMAEAGDVVHQSVRAVLAGMGFLPVGSPSARPGI